MKYFKHIILGIFTCFFISLNAQKVEVKGKTYEVKNDKIYLDGNEVTTILTPIEKEDIFKQALQKREDLNAEKLSKKLEKEKKKAEKAQRKAEKEQKKVASALKKQERLRNDYKKAEERLKKAQSKYDRLKEKGKLSPNEEEKWLEKIETLTKRFNKTKKRL